MATETWQESAGASMNDFISSYPAQPPSLGSLQMEINELKRKLENRDVPVPPKKPRKITLATVDAKLDMLISLITNTSHTN